MRTATDLPDATWYSPDQKNEKLYETLANKLEKAGKLLSLREIKSPYLTWETKTRIYHLKNSAVILIESINTSLNQYRVNVQVELYSKNKNSAKRLLEEILG